MNRTPEVIDVWFDSGSMPFAQYHYPFENKELFEEQFQRMLLQKESIKHAAGFIVY